MNDETQPLPETADVMRARAARLRAAAARELEIDAQFIDGPAYYNTQRGIQDRYAQAAALDKLAPKMKDSPVPDALRGRIHLVRKDVAAAQASFEAALKADAGYLPAALGLVAIDLQGKRSEAAVKRMEAFVASQPRVPQARLALAELLIDAGKPQAATPWLAMVGACAPPQGLLYQAGYLRAYMLLREERFREAAATFAALSAADRLDHRSRLGLGYARAHNLSGGFEGVHDGERHRGRVDGWKASGLPWTQD